MNNEGRFYRKTCLDMFLITAVIGFTVFSSVARLFALVLAGIEIAVVPQTLLC